MPRTLIGKFRLLGFVEGLSYLLILGVAMPRWLIYLLSKLEVEIPQWLNVLVMPNAIRVIGMTHGILFILYCLQLYLTVRHHKWSLGYAAYLFVAALIPFGTFYTDRRLRQLAAAQGKRIT